jgi:membrane-associated phospholipid phosphatase
MQRLPLAIKIWLASLVACGALVALSFAYADLRIERFWSHLVHESAAFGEGLGIAVILSAEAIAVAGVILARLLYGKVPRAGETLVVACLTSISVYAINSNVLKLFFGVPNPHEVIRGAAHAFNLWAGSPRSSFPSGHMALAAAFAGVFMRIYRASGWPFALFLALSGCLLIVGSWHFLSDVIAGTFVGLSAGLLAGELWGMHLRAAEAQPLQPSDAS